MTNSIIELHIQIPADLEGNISGQFDEHLKLIERTLNVTLISRDGMLKILGTEQSAGQARKLIEELVELARRGNTITRQNVTYALSLAMEERNQVLTEIDKDFICNTIQGRPVKPKTLGQKDDVEQIRHYRTDRHHDDGGNADGTDIAENRALGVEALQIQLQLGILFDVENQRHDARHDLTQYGCPCRARYAHIEYKDKDRVENDVDDRADALRNHGVDRAPRGGQQAFQHHFAENAEGNAAYDRQIAGAVLNDFRIGGLKPEEQIRAEQTEQQENRIAAQRNEYAVRRHAVGVFFILCAQRARNQRVYAHSAARRESDHQILRGKRQRYRVQRLLRYHADENAVHQIVQRLHQHRYYDGQRHRYNQLPYGHYAHLVFLHFLFFHVLLSSRFLL